jgi:hypothetical protein
LQQARAAALIGRNVERAARLGRPDCDRDAQAALGIKSKNHDWTVPPPPRCVKQLQPLDAKAPTDLVRCGTRRGAGLGKSEGMKSVERHGRVLVFPLEVPRQNTPP